MPILYVDNFRGFSKTFIPIKEINFFVGENSTGKSSILKLLGVLSSQAFLRYNIFSQKEDLSTYLGNYSDIISSSKKSFFEVAIIGPNANNQISAIKIKFIEQQEFPRAAEICYIDNHINLQMSINEHFVKYRSTWNTNKWFLKDNIKFFLQWIDDNSLNKISLETLNTQFHGPIDLLNQVVFSLKKTSNIKDQPIKIGIPNILNNTCLFQPNMASPTKYYEQKPLVFNSDGSHYPSILNKIIDNKGVKDILEKFGKDSNLFEELSIRKNNVNENTFEIVINKNNKKLNISNVGYGVSQILPLLIEVIARPNNGYFIFQQPENHLHPKGQTALGEFIYKSNIEDSHKFIIETHSDYIIDRFRQKTYHAQKKKAKYIPSQVVFFINKKKKNIAIPIEIEKDGSYSNSQPIEFRDFFINEQLNLLKM